MAELKILPHFVIEVGPLTLNNKTIKRERERERVTKSSGIMG